MELQQWCQVRLAVGSGWKLRKRCDRACRRRRHKVLLEISVFFLLAAFVWIPFLFIEIVSRKCWEQGTSHSSLQIEVLFPTSKSIVMEIWRSRILSSAERTESWSPMTSSVFQEITSHVSNCFKQKNCVRSITYADGSILGRAAIPFEAVSAIDCWRSDEQVCNQAKQLPTSLQLDASRKTTQTSSQWSFLFKSCHKKTRDEGAKNGKLSVDAENLS